MPLNLIDDIGILGKSDNNVSGSSKLNLVDDIGILDNQSEPQKSTLLTDPGKTLKRSGGEYVGNIFSAIGHPIQTTKSIWKLAVGGVQKFIPGEHEGEATLDAVADFYKERYGSMENVKQTALEDPIGFIDDLSLFLTGGGAAATKVGKISKLAKLAKAGRIASKVGQAIEPMGIATKVAGKGIQAVTKGKKIAPFAKQVDVDVVKAAKEAGVDLPASAKTTSKAVPAVETLVGKGFFGNKILKKVEQAHTSLNKYADDVITKSGVSTDLTQVGKDIFEASNKYKAEFIKIKNELYNKAIIPKQAGKYGEIITISPDKAIHFIDTILNDKKSAARLLGSSEDIKYFQNLKNQFSKKPNIPNNIHGLGKGVYKIPKKQLIDAAMYSDDMADFVNSLIVEIPHKNYLENVYKSVRKSQVSARDLSNAIKELNGKINNFTDPVSTGNRAKLKKLAALMGEDLDTAIISKRPELAKAIEAANEFYSQGINKLNSEYGKKIFKFKDQPDKILPSILNKQTSLEDIPKIYEIIGAENVPKVQTVFLEEMFKGARNAEGNFTPQGITRQINRYGGKDKLKAILNPDQFKAVENLEKLSLSMGKAEKIASGSQTAFVGRIASEAALLGMNPLQAVKVIAGDALLSKFVASKAGQKLLTEGIELTGKTGVAIQKMAPAAGAIARSARLAGITREESQ